ncbi:MAG: N-acetylmuramoyl-L-alanine amidase, partial [Epsilonproteobacteria bacterium]
MTKIILICSLLLSASLSGETLKIINKPIDFGSKRVEMTKSYIAQHYGMRV